MSIKKAAIVAVWLVVAALLFAWVLLSNSSDQLSTEMTNTSSKKMAPVEKEQPVTPDTAVDDLIDEAVADRDDLTAEETAELGNLESGNSLINDLSNVYDENE